MNSRPLAAWHSGVCDCFENASTCCYGFWCCPCLACTVSGRHGENTCLPLCDIFGSGVCAAVGIPVCVPPAGLSMRTSIRKTYNIKGSLCKDILVSCFCVWCSWCQLHRELKHQNKTTAVVNVINQTVIQQPAPMMMMQTQPTVYVAQH
ncbi:cornifelin homolog B-like [Entelurus aequoreus]|uniref:cornifelin homolog B-like n=1 Tax=Entelurus aequoreus TaxID=161455 RepID=UPI002B1E8952|nr:cornifelin homolog B-like [Entelurus aequoreus]